MSELLQEAEKVRHTAAQHYRAYQPKPLTKQDIDQVEILFGGLHWRAERLIQATLENLGYRARPLPAANKADLLLGRELAAAKAVQDHGVLFQRLVDVAGGALHLLGLARLEGAHRLLKALPHLFVQAAGLAA